MRSTSQARKGMELHGRSEHMSVDNEVHDGCKLSLIAGALQPSAQAGSAGERRAGV